MPSRNYFNWRDNYNLLVANDDNYSLQLEYEGEFIESKGEHIASRNLTKDYFLSTPPTRRIKIIKVSKERTELIEVRKLYGFIFLKHFIWQLVDQHFIHLHIYTWNIIKLQFALYYHLFAPWYTNLLVYKWIHFRKYCWPETDKLIIIFKQLIRIIKEIDKLSTLFPIFCDFKFNITVKFQRNGYANCGYCIFIQCLTNDKITNLKKEKSGFNTTFVPGQ